MKNKPVNNGKPWSLESDYNLMILASTGINLDAVSECLGRSKKAICSRLHRVILPRSEDRKEKIIAYLEKAPAAIYNYKKALYFSNREQLRKKYKRQ